MNTPRFVQAYTLDALTNLPTKPVIAKRVPTTADTGYGLGTIWVDVPDNLSFILTSVVNGLATWTSPATSGAITGTGLIITPGPITLTGTTGINASGAAVTTIGTGGTGALHLGNATGNTAVTGSLSTTTSLSATTTVIAGTGVTATTGNIVASAGNISTTVGSISSATTLTATLGNITATNGNVVMSTATNHIVLPGPIKIMSGAGAPAAGLAAEVGDMYINTTAASAVTRLYIATAASTWTNVTCAA